MPGGTLQERTWKSSSDSQLRTKTRDYGDTVGGSGKNQQTAISERQHDTLMDQAFKISDKTTSLGPGGGEPLKVGTRKLVQHLHVPYEETIKVPVKKHVPKSSTRKEVLKGTEVLPVKKYKDVEVVVVDVRERKVEGTRKVWKLVEEPYEEVVKEPIKRVITKRVPYTDYVEKKVEKVVEVPCHRVETHIGHRYDKIMKTKVVEVEQDQHYELHPVHVGTSAPRVREMSHDHIGVIQRGKCDFSTPQILTDANRGKTQTIRRERRTEGRPDGNADMSRSKGENGHDKDARQKLGRSDMDITRKPKARTQSAKPVVAVGAASPRRVCFPM
mmetsp:Transcript_9974/g.26438  ORF Transcript_9974/g.26438 Transcript_9974/m.26438 type:complete len:329 (+) Transcript_9974:114-1100(+)